MSDFLIGTSDAFRTILPGVPLTLRLMFEALILGTVLGFFLFLVRLSKLAWLGRIAVAYVSVIRGTPLLVQIYLIYFGLGQFDFVRGSPFWPYLREPFTCAVIALVANSSAYISEILRGGYLSVTRGTVEAGRALALSRYAIWRTIIIPLMARNTLPAYGNEVISLLKSTSLASTITVLEVTGLAKDFISQSYLPLEGFVAAAAVYLSLNAIFISAFTLAERRFHY